VVEDGVRNADVPAVTITQQDVRYTSPFRSSSSPGAFFLRRQDGEYAGI
jgi:hypothetical protein